YYRANLGDKALLGSSAAPQAIAVPTQLVWGDRDPALGSAQAHLTHKYVTGEYRLEVLAGAGHWLQFERAAEVSNLLLEWIRTHWWAAAPPPQEPPPNRPAS